MTARNTNPHLHEITPNSGVHAAEFHPSTRARINQATASSNGSDTLSVTPSDYADHLERRRSSLLSSDMRRKIRLWLDERDFYSLFAIIGVVFAILLLIVFVTDFSGPPPSRF